jgi:hypothetical protein
LSRSAISPSEQRCASLARPGAYHLALKHSELLKKQGILHHEL